MATFLIGDVQGCYDELRSLLRECAFDFDRDHAVFLGDLVNRGPKSLQVLQFVRDMGTKATVLLGNHDLHLLATAHGVRKPSRKDTLDELLNHADAPALLKWLRQQNIALHLPEHGLLCVHAGVLPSWSLADCLVYAQELQHALRTCDYGQFLAHMYGDEPAHWDDQHTGTTRFRAFVNAFTRLRFCNAKGEMDHKTKEGADAAPAGYMPWFEVPGRATQSTRIAFGHWSTLGLKLNAQIAALDTGCVWGGALSALRLAQAQPGKAEQLFQVPCTGYQAPG
jgi:bis(5'-nucleosyl)-tetraphosphatase (symmetrical)